MQLKINIKNDPLDFNQMTAMLFGLCLCGNKTKEHLRDAGCGMFNYEDFSWFILQSYPFDRLSMSGKACILLYDFSGSDNEPLEFDDFPFYFGKNIIFCFAKKIGLQNNIVFCRDEHVYFNGEIVIDDVDVEMVVLFLTTYTDYLEKVELS